MQDRGLLQRRSVSTVGAAVFGGLAALMATLSFEVPFPILPYLKFDFAEVPVVIAFLLFGPVPGFLAATIHWLFLTVRSGVLGPAIKFAAVVSMLAGIWLGSKLRLRANRSSASQFVGLGIMFTVGLVIRVLLLTLVNYAVLVYVAPVFFGQDYLKFAAFTLKSTLGLTLANVTDLIIYTLIYTAIFNSAHVAFAAIPAFAIVLSLHRRLPMVAEGRPWIDRIVH